MSNCQNSTLGSIIGTQLIENMNDMAFNRMRANGQNLGNLRISVPFGVEPAHFLLAANQTDRDGDLLALIQVHGLRRTRFSVELFCQVVRVLLLRLSFQFSLEQGEY